jgi:DedD protein
MRGTFDDEELAPVKPRRDTELTLGSGALLAIFLGLALLCVLCFGLGYAFGHRGTVPASAALPAPSQPMTAGNSIAKPPATAQPDQSQSPDEDNSGQAATSASPAPSAQVIPTAATANGEPGQPSVHPALASTPVPAQSAQTPPPATVQPAVAQASAAPAGSLPTGSLPTGSLPTGSLMVQIAAVSHAEDAEVLTDALRKRGYPVSARRDPADNLIHVRIGPFATLAEANSWRTKLLGDGYNAIVQQ